MIESTQARQRGAYDFESHYNNLCALQDSVPLPAVKANLSSGILDINADRIRSQDWKPIIQTLQINKSLECVAVRSQFAPPPDTDDKRAALLRKKTPSIRSKEITFRLCKALQSCLAVTPTLMFIELTGVPLRERDISWLVKGLMKNNTLVHLSLELCRIGDNGLEIICKGLKNNNKLSRLNLTGCSLTGKGGELVAKLIKHQAMRRHSEAWRDSLRYGEPQMDRMPGLRRITLNNNPLIGNQGAQAIAEALKDDLWVKALDLHGTGMSSTGAKAFLDVLQYNSTIEVLDLRRNPLIDRNVLHTVMEHLMINCNGKDTEYQWIEPAQEEATGKWAPNRPPRSRRRATKILNNSIGKKTTIKVTPTSARRRPPKSASCAAVNSQRDSDDASKQTPGLPWRTAARANRYRGYPPERTPRKYLEDSSEGETSPIMARHENSLADTSLDVLSERKSPRGGDARWRSNPLVKELQVELEQTRRMLKEERIERSKADQRVMQLLMENRRLEDEVRLAKLRQGSGVTRTGHTMDESTLDNIESTLNNYHRFLDLLREAGLGQLITMAGLDQQSSPLVNGWKLTSPAGPPDPQPSPPAHRLGNSNMRPERSGGLSGGMSHVNEAAYVREKEEADEVYQRLLKQTSGAFTSNIGAAAVLPLMQGSGDLPSDPKVKAPTEAGEAGCPSALASREPADGEKAGGADDPPSPRFLPQHRSRERRENNALGVASDPEDDRRPPSRHSHAGRDLHLDLDSCVQTYVSEERGEVVVLGDDGDAAPPSHPTDDDDDDDDDF